MVALRERAGDDTGFQTFVWGPAGWIFLHSIAQNYPWKPTEEQMGSYYTFFKSVGNVLPCRYCRESYQKFIDQKGTCLTMDTMKSRKTLFLWLYNIHNSINKKLGVKNHPTKQEVWEKYESFRAKCHKSPEKYEKPKKGCHDPMRGFRKKCVISIVNVDEQGNEFGKQPKKKTSQKQNDYIPPSVSEEDKFIKSAMETLGVTDRNNVNEIKKNYRKLSMIYHPDRPTGNEEKFKEISNAYEMLMQLNGMKFGYKQRISYKQGISYKRLRFGKSQGKRKNIKLINIKKSNKSGKKLMATFETNGRRKVIHFGSSGMRDYTIMGHDKNRMRLYRQRHMKDLKTGNPTRAGFLSMYVLWNKPSLQASISDYRRRLNVYNRTGKFPTKF